MTTEEQCSPCLLNSTLNFICFHHSMQFNLHINVLPTRVMREFIQKQTILGIIDLYTIAVNCNRAILLYIIVNIVVEVDCLILKGYIIVYYCKYSPSRSNHLLPLHDESHVHEVYSNAGKDTLKITARCERSTMKTRMERREVATGTFIRPSFRSGSEM